MKDRPIGVFDSGVGGLTAVKALKATLPGEDIIYFGDTARVPYGSRSKETIKKYARQAICYLASFGVKAIIAACGTVSSNFTQEDFAKLGLDIPYITIIAPTALEAVTHVLEKTPKIGVIATAATIKSESFDREIEKYNKPDHKIAVVGVGCPILVTLVENGLTDKNHPVTRAALEMYLEPIKKEDIDVLILGCTHFPLLKEAIAHVMGKKMWLIDPGVAVAQQMYNILKEKNELSGKTERHVEYYVTDTVDNFIAVAKNFLVEDITGDVHFVDVRTIDTTDDRRSE